MGYPNEKEYEQKAKELGLSNQISFTGRMDYGELPSYLNAADIAVSAKLPGSEGNGKLCNYLASGLPTVAFDTPTNRDLLGVAGILVPEISSNAFAHALDNLIDDMHLRECLAKSARERAVQLFSWKGVARSIVEIYEAKTYG